MNSGVSVLVRGQEKIRLFGHHTNMAGNGNGVLTFVDRTRLDIFQRNSGDFQLYLWQPKQVFKAKP